MALASGKKQGKVYSGTLAPSDTSLIGRRLQFLPPTYLFSKDPLASIGLDWLQWSLQLYIIPELKLPGHMIRCPLTALLHGEKGSLLLPFSKNQLASDGPYGSYQWSFQLTNLSSADVGLML